MKSLPERIAYYTRKVREITAHHPSKKLPAKYTYRNERLLAYKKRMHELINDAGYTR